MDALRRALLAQIGWQGAGDGVFLARERHLDACAAPAPFWTPPSWTTPTANCLPTTCAWRSWRSDITGEFSADDLLGEILGGFVLEGA